MAVGTKRGRKAPPRARQRPPAPPVGAGERFELAMRAVNEGVYDWDVASGTIYYSEAVYSVLHMPRSVKTPAGWRKRIDPDDLAAYDAALVAHFKKKTRRFECDYRYQARDRTWRWARQHGMAIRDQRGRVVRMIGSTGDITEMKRVEQALKESQDRYALATQAATEGIYEWNLVTGSLYLSERAKEFFAVRGKALTPAAWNRRVHKHDFPGYRAALAAFFTDREAKYFEHEYRIRDAEGGYAWIVDRAVAERDARGRVLRMIGALSDVTERKQHELELARARDEATEALERQTATAEILKVISSSPTDMQPVFEAIVQNAHRLFGRSAVFQIVRDGALHIGAAAGFSKEAGEKATALYPMPLTDSPSRGRQAMREGNILETLDIEVPGTPSSLVAVGRAAGFRSIVTVPLLRDHALVGNLSLTSESVQPRLDGKQLALLKTFADQAVIAIENVRLFNETKEALERQTAIGEILRVISNSPADVQPVLDAVAERAARICDARVVDIVLRDGDVQRVAATFGDLGRPLGMAVPLNRDTVMGRSIVDGKPVQVADLQTTEGEFALGRELAIKYGHRSILAVPLMREGSALGTILVRRAEVRPFDGKHVALLQTFADQAAIAIQNARLFNETKEALEQQKASADVLQVIAGSMADPLPVFEKILENCSRLFRGTTQALNLLDDDDVVHLAAQRFDPSSLPQAFSEAQQAAIRDLGHTAYPIKLQGKEAQWMRRGKDVYSVSDVLNDPRAGPALRAPALVLGFSYAQMGATMFSGDKCVGSIVVNRPVGEGFTAKEQAQLVSFADQAVIAIQNARLFRETNEALERQTATAEILKVIASSPSDVQPVFDAIAASARRLLDGGAALVARRDGDLLQLAAYTSTSEAADAALKKLWPSPITGKGHMGRAVLSASPVLVDDIQNDASYSEAFRESARTRGLRSVVSVPMLREGDAIGVISVNRPVAGRFSDHQTNLLKTFADQAVIAIENVRLFNETREALERQTATAEVLASISGSMTDTKPVFDAIVRNLRRLFGTRFAVLQLFRDGIVEMPAIDGDPEFPVFMKLQEQFPRPLDETTVGGQAMLTKQAFQLAPVIGNPAAPPATEQFARDFGFNSVIFAPMIHEAKVVGAIGAAHPGDRPFDERKIALIKTFADQAVIAIENVRLFNELQAQTTALKRSVGQLTALGEVGQAISSTLDLATVLQTIVSRAVQLTGLNGGTIYEFDERAGEFLLRAHENMPAELVELYRNKPIRLGEGVVGSAAATRAPVQVADIQGTEYQSRYRDQLIRQGYRAILAVPLLRDEHIIGALTVSRGEPGEFPPEIVELLKTFATQSAMAIQNARLFREIAEKGRQLELASQHKSNFLASMSHELRTPLNAILGFNEMILGQVYGEVPADMQEPLADIQTSGKHLLRLINNVLDLAKIEAGRMELSLQDYSVHDTVGSVHSTLRPLASEKGLEFLVNVPEDVPLAYGDGGRITQCLMNLAGNSIKFTKAGRVEIAVEAKDGLLTYRVIDTGIGIPPDKIASLFTEFKQTDATIASEYGGTGLGLSISKKFVEMHGGRIWIESELGKGSVFIIEVPQRVNAP